MTHKVLWDVSEAVIMLDALISFYKGNMSRKEAIESVSSELRARAKRNGMEVDDIFRNINGITLQMSKMEYILTDGKNGMKKSSISKVFQNAVAMYRNDRSTYEKILREARSVAKPPIPLPARTKYIETAVPSTADNAINKIDFTNIQPLAFTKPTKYSYFGYEQTNFNSWTQLYVQVVQCMLDDYANVLMSYTNRNIDRHSWCDFSDAIGMRSMTAPKKLKDNFYLETNLSPTNIMNKIKKLLELCNVDYENLEIFYQKLSSTVSPANAEATTAHVYSEDKFSGLKIADSSARLQDISEKNQIRYAEILLNHFSEDGYQLGRVIVRERFKQFYAEKYDSEPAETDEDIDKIMSIVGNKLDDRIFPKQDNRQNDLILKIVNDILSAFASGVTAVYIEAVFDKYQQQLANDLHIYHQDALTSLLIARANGKYTRYNSLLTNNLSAINEQEDLIRIMKTFHQPQNYAAIHKKAWFLPVKKIKNILGKIDSIVNVAAETYFYAPNFPISAEERTHLSSLMTEELNYNSYITDDQLKQLIIKKCPSIAINTDGYTTLGLRKCLAYMFKEQFTFNGHIITFKDKTLSTADVLVEFAKNHEILSVDELSTFSDERNILINWDAVFSEMIRISDTKLVRKDHIKFDEEALDDILDKICQENYMPLTEINLFLHFPNIGYPWNSYLLESYLFSCSKKFRLLHSSFSKTGVYGAMVRKNADFPDYRSLLVDVLSKSNALGSTKEALQYIVDKGYQQRRRYEGIETVIQKAKLVKEQREKQEK